MLITMIAIWVLQLFPATPKLAPIYNAVTHMVPPPFPLLLVVPAIAIDMLLGRFRDDRDWLLAVVMGFAFIAIMLAVHWFWSQFMLSPGARNYFFGADQWDYTNRLGPWRHQFWGLDVDASGSWSATKFLSGMGMATVLAILSTRAGLAWGKGMSRVKR
jgi:hypothetical protein